MVLRFTAIVFAALLALPSSANAENLCDQQCTIDIEFPEGGSILAKNSTTFTFGDSGLVVMDDTASILKFLENNPGAHLLLPTEASEELSAAGGGRFGERIRAVIPERGHPQTIEINGFTVTVFNLDHRSEVENIGIMVALGGKTYFHLGDFSSAEFEENAISGIAVDYLLTPYWYLRNEQNYKILIKHIRADYLIPMHLPRPDPPEDFTERVGSFAELMANIQARSGNVRVLYEEGACLRGD